MNRKAYRYRKAERPTSYPIVRIVHIAGKLYGRLVILPLLLLVLLTTGCSAAIPDTADRINRPSNESIPLEGTWKLENYLNKDNEVGNARNEAAVDNLTGEIIGFSADSILYAGSLLRDVSYKIKRVKTSDYFLHKNQELVKVLSFNSDEIFIISVYNEDKFLFEFIEDQKGKIIANIDEQYYYMKKISDEFNGDDTVRTSTNGTREPEDVKIKNQMLRSGILLGIRTPAKTSDGLGDYTYGTYWISAVNRDLQPVLYAKDIYLPRKDGFWSFQVKKRLGSEGIEDYLYASKETRAEASAKIINNTAVPDTGFENFSGRVETKLRKAVAYIGNDYVCIENIVYIKKNGDAPGGVVKTLRTLPVDNLNSIEGIKISDLAGENGTMAMDNAVSELLKDTKGKGIKSTDGDTGEMNFGLYRKTGHWFLKGRLNTADDGHNAGTEGQLPYMDFNLNLIPPADMVAYDILQVPWKDMKDKLPQATDIYTSPNQDLAIVQTHNELLLYAIENKSLSEKPLGKLQLAEGSQVIMAEWATGSYVQSWERYFKRNNEYVPMGT